MTQTAESGERLFHYSIYGVRLASDTPIPGLTPNGGRLDGDFDIRAYFLSSPKWLPNAMRAGARRWVGTSQENESLNGRSIWEIGGGEFIAFNYSHGMRCFVNIAEWELWMGWPAPLVIEDAALYLLGPILGFLVALRGSTVLHASVVCVGDFAVALVGPGGAGKSTTAAALALRGHPVLTEDVAPIIARAGSFYVLPGYPAIRLWDASVVSLFGTTDSLERLSPNGSKRLFPLDGKLGHFMLSPRPLRAIYLLGERGEAPSMSMLQAIGHRDGLFALLANSYASYLLGARARVEEFKTYSTLAATVPIRRVAPLTAPEGIDALVDAIVSDCLNLATGL